MPVSPQWVVTMVHDGKRAIVMDVLLHFPDEAEPRRVFFNPLPLSVRAFSGAEL
jgi:hypothetical protein